MFFLPEHLFEQYFTFSQLSFHFFLQLNGLLQTIHNLVGKWDFFILIDVYFLEIKNMQQSHTRSETI